MLKSIRKNILGQKIVRIRYSEANHLEGPFYFSNFDTFDYGINVEMDNGYEWHIYWKEDYKIKLGEGEYFCRDDIYVEVWDATDRWKSSIHSKISNFLVDFVDYEKTLPQRCQIQFENGKIITIYIAEELNQDKSLPDPFTYTEVNDIYVFFNDQIPNWKPVKLEAAGSYLDEKPGLDYPTLQISSSKIIWFLIILIILAVGIYLTYESSKYRA